MNIKTSRTITTTIQDDDIEPMKHMVRQGYDTSGIIAHILDEIGIDTDLDTDVQSTDVEQPQ